MSKRVFATMSDELWDAMQLMRRAAGFARESDFIAALVREQAMHDHDLTTVRQFAAFTGYERDKLDAQMLLRVRHHEASKPKRFTFDELGALISNPNPNPQ